jgi:hypothetical protein
MFIRSAENSLQFSPSPQKDFLAKVAMFAILGAPGNSLRPAKLDHHTRRNSLTILSLGNCPPGFFQNPPFWSGHCFTVTPANPCI